MWYLILGQFPSVRGLVVLFFAALGGWWFLGDNGAWIMLGLVSLAAMIRPQMSGWLRDTLHGARAFFWAFAGLSLLIGAGRLGLNPQTVIRAGAFALMGLPFHLRLRSLQRLARVVPTAAAVA